MKKLTFILLFIPLLSFGQIEKDEIYSLVFDAVSISAEAMGDAYFDMGNKEVGHALQAASVGVLLTQPFVIDFEKKDFWWKIPAYTLLRFAIFDGVYNLTRGQPYYLNGSTSYYDNVMSELMPGKWADLPRMAAFTIAISITLRYKN